MLLACVPKNKLYCLTSVSLSTQALSNDQSKTMEVLHSGFFFADIRMKNNQSSREIIITTSIMLIVIETGQSTVRTYN